jgi:thymidylate synthase
MALHMECILVANGGQAHNFIGQIERMTESAYTHETALFPLRALDAYSKANLGDDLDLADMQQFADERGGDQGDYRKGMQQKIEQVTLALMGKRTSKRAVLTVPFTDKCSLCVKTDDTPEWKCLREVYFRLDENNVLHATGVMRSQALSILPKNLHMIGRLMDRVAKDLGARVGSYVHICHFLVSDRT